MPVDDSGTVEIVGRELAANAISGQDANPKAAHLARDVPEHHVIVVELYAKHRIRQGLDHLALEFDLVFLSHELYPVRVLCAPLARDPC
jgi:hypothetical protein